MPIEPDPPPTLLHVARAAGVAKSTASLAFSAPQRVRADTRERVLGAARALGYAPNALARSLATGRNGLLALVLSDMLNPHSGATQAAVQARAYERGYLLIVGTSRADPAAERELLERFAALRVRGVVLVTSGTDASHARALEAMRLELVSLDQRLAAGTAHVGLDNADAAERLVEHLVGLGHRRVAHVAGRRGTWTAERRLDGVRAALARAGLDFPERCLVEGEYDERLSRERCLALLGAPDPPTALVAANNLCALGARQAILDAGLRCPEDVSLAAIDDLPGGTLVVPRLTHVEQPLESMCAAAVDRLVDALEGEVRRDATSVEMRGALVEGGSTAAPPDGARRRVAIGADPRGEPARRFVSRAGAARR